MQGVQLDSHSRPTRGRNRPWAEGRAEPLAQARWAATKRAERERQRRSAEITSATRNRGGKPRPRPPLTAQPGQEADFNAAEVEGAAPAAPCARDEGLAYSMKYVGIMEGELGVLSQRRPLRAGVPRAPGQAPPASPGLVHLDPSLRRGMHSRELHSGAPASAAVGALQPRPELYDEWVVHAPLPPRAALASVKRHDPAAAADGPARREGLDQRGASAPGRGGTAPLATSTAAAEEGHEGVRSRYEQQLATRRHEAYSRTMRALDFPPSATVRPRHPTAVRRERNPEAPAPHIVHAAFLGGGVHSPRGSLTVDQAAALEARAATEADLVDAVRPVGGADSDTASAPYASTVQRPQLGLVPPRTSSQRRERRRQELELLPGGAKHVSRAPPRTAATAPPLSARPGSQHPLRRGWKRRGRGTVPPGAPAPKPGRPATPRSRQRMTLRAAKAEARALARRYFSRPLSHTLGETPSESQQRMLLAGATALGRDVVASSERSRRSAEGSASGRCAGAVRSDTLHRAHAAAGSWSTAAAATTSGLGDGDSSALAGVATEDEALAAMVVPSAGPVWDSPRSSRPSAAGLANAGGRPGSALDVVERTLSRMTLHSRNGEPRRGDEATARMSHSAGLAVHTE